MLGGLLAVEPTGSQSRLADYRRAASERLLHVIRVYDKRHRGRAGRCAGTGQESAQRHQQRLNQPARGRRSSAVATFAIAALLLFAAGGAMTLLIGASYTRAVLSLFGASFSSSRRVRNHRCGLPRPDAKRALDRGRLLRLRQRTGRSLARQSARPSFSRPTDSSIIRWRTTMSTCKRACETPLCSWASGQRQPWVICRFCRRIRLYTRRPHCMSLFPTWLGTIVIIGALSCLLFPWETGHAREPGARWRQCTAPRLARSPICWHSPGWQPNQGLITIA